MIRPLFLYHTPCSTCNEKVWYNLTMDTRKSTEYSVPRAQRRTFPEVQRNDSKVKEGKSDIQSVYVKESESATPAIAQEQNGCLKAWTMR